ncbi:Uncharacterised protein [Vibrio cholerae]|nr:Uncharacterised protein [Vibrio cholerae]CSI41314.1 Uncharacterised protein [Vibrio cholerae]
MRERTLIGKTRQLRNLTQIKSPLFNQLLRHIDAFVQHILMWGQPHLLFEQDMKLAFT